MSDSTSAIRPGWSTTGADGAMRLGVSYPPPPPPPAPAPAPAPAPVAPPAPPPPSTRTPGVEAEIEALLARTPQVTRYERARRRPTRTARPHNARIWAGTSAALAAAGVSAVVLLPQDDSSARLDAPLAVVAPSAAAAGVSAELSAEPALSEARIRQLTASDPVRVQIPALGVTSSVIRLGLERDGSMEVPSGAYPVGWYDGSPTPGELGPAVLAGHVDWGGERGAFYGLRELRPGDTVAIDRADGTTATFRIDRVERHAKDDFPTEEVYGDVDHAGLRLITCGGSFDEASGGYRDNVIVFATLAATGSG